MDNPFRDLEPEQNPYANFGMSPGEPMAGRVDVGMINHVRVVGILQVVQGSLVLLVGLGLGVMGLAMPMIMRADPDFREEMMDGPPMWIFPVIYGGMGIALSAVGLVQIVAGVRTYRFRNRVFGIVAICLGMCASLTCYCAPTAIGLMIYGLIVYLNGPVVVAFDRVQQGESVDQVLASHYAFLLERMKYAVGPPM
ncbi:MAG: hypothetical protein FJ276_08855 [Planctomycetes bacterium]|nr:hypothetical protein [Planctomycetota bacterium]